MTVLSQDQIETLKEILNTSQTGLSSSYLASYLRSNHGIQISRYELINILSELQTQGVTKYLLGRWYLTNNEKKYHVIQLPRLSPASNRLIKGDS
jgi:intein-encoded DNA endonuclease-like protein